MPTIYENKLLLPAKWTSISVTCHIWSMALYGAKIWTIQKRYHKYRESFEAWCWRRMEKIALNMEEYYTHNQGEKKRPTHNKKKEG
jgi:hypothetical protein